MFTTETIPDLVFVECAVCAAKPGSPQLCVSCLSNRTAINILNRIVRAQAEKLSLATYALSLYLGLGIVVAIAIVVSWLAK